MSRSDATAPEDYKPGPNILEQWFGEGLVKTKPEYQVVLVAVPRHPMQSLPQAFPQSWVRFWRPRMRVRHPAGRPEQPQEISGIVGPPLLDKTGRFLVFEVYAHFELGNFNDMLRMLRAIRSFGRIKRFCPYGLLAAPDQKSLDAMIRRYAEPQVVAVNTAGSGAVSPPFPPAVKGRKVRLHPLLTAPFKP